MELFINGEKIDAVLENEQNASEIIRSLSAAMAEEEAVITEITVDGIEYTPGDELLAGHGAEITI